MQNDECRMTKGKSQKAMRRKAKRKTQIAKGKSQELEMTKGMKGKS